MMPITNPIAGFRNKEAKMATKRKYPRSFTNASFIEISILSDEMRNIRGKLKAEPWHLLIRGKFSRIRFHDFQTSRLRWVDEQE
jgi:hypothetical protein